MKEVFITEWEHKCPAHQRQQQTNVPNRISAVKQKGQTPTFHQQQQPKAGPSNYHQRAGPSGPQQTGWKQRSKCGGAKNKKKSKPASGKGKSRAHYVDGESASDFNDRLFATAALAENSQGDAAPSPSTPSSSSIDTPISEPAAKLQPPRMVASGSRQFGHDGHYKHNYEKEAQ
jgi:hypothetical protein